MVARSPGTVVPPVRATFLAEPPFAVGAHAVLSQEDAHHIRVLRLGVGERVALRDGAGHVAAGRLVRIMKGQALVEVDEAVHVASPPPIHVLVPVADRDRTLWLAEKLTELNVATWRPVLWHRSKSVFPRGEGSTFRAKVHARMVSAMLQSRSAWLPEIFPESTPDRAVVAAPLGSRIVLDVAGAPMVTAGHSLPMTIAIGPEGGFEPTELALLTESGFMACTLGSSILRFETAAVAAVAVARAMLLTTEGGLAPPHGALLWSHDGQRSVAEP